MKAKKIFIGSWFQRTTLHLSEIYDFLTIADSPLNLDSNKLAELRDNLELENVYDIHDDFEYISAEVKNGISFKIYEDGLIVLSSDPSDDIKKDIDQITSYYEDKLSVGLKYIFSLGAPIPKELANIKTVYPYFIIFDKAEEKEIHDLLADFGQDKHFEIKKKTFSVYRGETLYIINTHGESLETIEKFIGEQIFIREFKAQMHRYLNLHRTIWENIAKVKEAGSIKGKDIKELKAKIEAYQKSISMIDTRINQMGAYIETRNSIVKNDPEMEKFIDVLQFKYESLNSTLTYIKEIWQMTNRYVESAVTIFSGLKSKATVSSLKNLTVVTSMGVGATLIGLLSKNELPEITTAGAVYFAIVALIGYLVNKLTKIYYENKEYKIKNIKADTDITQTNIN